MLAANRDEYHARPALAAAPWPQPSGVLGGRDLVGGGSWLLAEASGRVAALTNYRGSQVPEKPRTRGELVAGFLASTLSPVAYVERLRAQRHEYAGFNLLMQQQGQWWIYCSESNHLSRPAEKWFAVSNGDPADIWPKMRWTGRRVHAANQNIPVDQQRVFDLMGRRAGFASALPDTGVGSALERGLSSPFIALPGYGTRCTTLVCGNQDGALLFRERSYNEHGEVSADCLWQSRAASAGDHWRALALQERHAIE